MEDQIYDYKNNYIANYKKYNQINSKKSPNKQTSILLQILSSNVSLDTIVRNAYEFNKETNYSDSEVLNKILDVDFAQLFTIAIIKIDFDLQTTNLVDSFVKKLYKINFLYFKL